MNIAGLNVPSAVLAAAICAGGSFVATMTLLSPERLDATQPLVLPANTNLMPSTIRVDGLELSLRVNGNPTGSDPLRLEPGRPLELELLASNPTDRTIQSRLAVTIHATEPASPLSRVLPAPRQVYSIEQYISVPPQQTSALRISPEQNLTQPPGRRLTIGVSAGQASMSPIFVVLAAEPQTQP
ncbi:hypothetical protein [Fontivita pretiosa]|uniref:hypothetical protein n=1 Tax=Fontivita pretiosa TaxID=2989684 RepID=UPI003D17592C